MRDSSGARAATEPPAQSLRANGSASTFSLLQGESGSSQRKDICLRTLSVMNDACPPTRGTSKRIERLSNRRCSTAGDSSPASGARNEGNSGTVDPCGCCCLGGGGSGRGGACCCSGCSGRLEYGRGARGA